MRNGLLSQILYITYALLNGKLYAVVNKFDSGVCTPLEFSVRYVLSSTLHALNSLVRMKLIVPERIRKRMRKHMDVVILIFWREISIVNSTGVHLDSESFIILWQ